MKENRQFITNHREFELMSEYPACTALLNEYIRNDNDRANAQPNVFPIVYDCIDPSPYYDSDDPNDMFIDERDAIDLPNPTDQIEGTINEPY